MLGTLRLSDSKEALPRQRSSELLQLKSILEGVAGLSKVIRACISPT